MNYKDSRLSYSSLKAFAKSPRHFIQYKENPPDSSVLAFGRAAHCWILEGMNEFNRRFAIAPKIDRRTKAGKETFAAFQIESEGKQIVTADEFATIRQMQTSVYGVDVAQDMIELCQTEIWKEGMIHGFNFGGFADLVDPGDLYACDLKTCQDASPEAFTRDAHNFDYHLQAAIYRHLFGVERFYWICVEKKPPYNVQVYIQSDTAAQRAEERLQELLNRWGHWDGTAAHYFPGVLTLDLPRWAK